MKEIDIDELKKLQLDILSCVHEFCLSNGIDYFITAGSLIGAIRHKGYIPWDDDIDICMTRPNYNKFLKSFNGTYKQLQVLSPELNWNFYAPYANVCDIRTVLVEENIKHRGIEVGVKIDIFPVDGIPNSLRTFQRQCKSVFKCNYIMKIKRARIREILSFSALKLICKKIVYSYITYESLQKKINSVALQNDYYQSDLAGNITFDPIVYRVPRHFFETFIDVEFEGYTFKTIKDYDLYLRLMYGDYMKLPPMEMRVPHHGFKAYWKD